MTALRALIVGPLARGILGGQEVEAALLIQKWQKDPDVNVAFLPSNPRLPKWMRIIERIPYIRTLLRLPVYLASLLRATSHVDVVHVFSASYTSFLLTCLPAWLISQLQRKAVVLNYHTARGWQKFANSKIVRFVLKRTEKIVVPSAYLEAKFEEAGWKVNVISNIIGDHFRYRARCSLQPHILCARNLSPDYGIEVAINAFAVVQAQYPNATLTLLGDGPLRQSLQNQVRCLGLSGVTFCGSVPNEQMPQWYDRAEIFLNASYVDNAPLSILEAMACGVPVVTTDAGGIPLIVRHEETGLIAPVGSAKMLAEQMIRLLSEPEFGAIIARQAKESLEAYGWWSVRQKWQELYQAAAQIRRQP